MNRDRMPDCIWDVDPHEGREPGYEEFEDLFRAAFEHAYERDATLADVRPYLQRYFRFRVVPPWLRAYVRDVLRGVAIQNIGTAPLDPVIDLRHLRRRLSGLYLLVFGIPEQKKRKGACHFEA